MKQIKTVWVVKRVINGTYKYLNTVGGTWSDLLSGLDYFPTATLAMKELRKAHKFQPKTHYTPQYSLIRYDYSEEIIQIDNMTLDEIEDPIKDVQNPVLDPFGGIPKCECGHFISVHNGSRYHRTLAENCTLNNCKCLKFKEWPMAKLHNEQGVTGNFPSIKPLPVEDSKKLKLLIEARDKLKAKGEMRSAKDLDKQIFELQFGASVRQECKCGHLEPLHYITDKYDEDGYCVAHTYDADGMLGNCDCSKFDPKET
jgi:hypothetical protein